MLLREPLAECKVQYRKPPEQREQMPNNLVLMRQPNPAGEALRFYARGHDGQWNIPAEVDRDDPWVRVLIMGPTAPVVIDLAVFVEGTAFRDLREQWVDSLVEKATSPQSADSEAEQEEPKGTEEKDAAVEGTEIAETEDSTELEKDEDTPAVVKVRSRVAPTAVERLRQYLAAGVAATDREEIRWLIAEWNGGPGLLTLSPAVSWRRAEIAPLWSLLDADHDGVLSAGEIKGASEKLAQADGNEDDVVEVDELQDSGEGYSPYFRPMSHPLVVVLNEQTPWNVLLREIVKLYGAGGQEHLAGNQLKDRISRGDQSLASHDLAGLLNVAPDICCRFDMDPDKGKIALLAAENGTSHVGSSSEQVISVDCVGTYVELSALTMQESTAMPKSQLAIGAVVDGYPLFRLLDQDNNRRLTLRESRKLEDCLAGLDLDADGQIAGAEIPTAIRVVVTRGLLVHEALSQPIAASKELGERNSAAIPSWFADMDRNSDGDLSRREFLGTKEQFNRLDQDGDGLINTKETQDSPTGNE